MLKITLIEVGFKEIPDEISMVVYFSGCPIRCPECHSKDYWDVDAGKEYPINAFLGVLDVSDACTCITFMGGDWDKYTLNKYVGLCKGRGFKTAIYTGSGYGTIIEDMEFYSQFDYIKYGPYMEQLGGLSDCDTNQRLFKKSTFRDQNLCTTKWVDITYKFWA